MEKSTKELLEQMKSGSDYRQYRQQNMDQLTHGPMKLQRALTILLAEKGLKKSHVIQLSGIEQHYAYQIFSGAKIPSSDKVVMLCVALGLNVDETQDLLKVTGYPSLYAKNDRDNVILFGITHHKSVMDINADLFENNLEILQ